MNSPTKPNLWPSRADALRKLLALGDLHRVEIDSIMGGDKSDITRDLNSLVLSGEVRIVPDGSSGQVYQLQPVAQAHAFAEVTVVSRRLVEVVNFAEVA